MEYLERELRESQKQGDQERAGIVAVMRSSRAEDIPFPSSIPVLSEVPIADKTFGQLLRELREGGNLSQDRLSNLVSCHQTLLSKYELDDPKRFPNRSLIDAIVNALQTHARPPITSDEGLKLLATWEKTRLLR